MFVWKKYMKTKTIYGIVESEKEYKILLLFGIIPLFISING